MKKTIFVFTGALAVAASLAVFSATPAAAQPRQQCLRNNQIDSFQPIRGNQRAIVVVDRFRNKYKLNFNTICDDIQYNGALAIRSQSNSNLSCIERGDIVVSRGIAGGADRCVITSVTPYTAAMERADRDQNRYRR
jgi:hypothetical protein